MESNMESFKMGSILKYFPLIVILIYLSITVALFAFGPFNYPVKYPYRLYGFLFSVNLMILFGYFFGINKKETVFRSGNGFKLLRKAIAVQIIFIPLTNYANTGSFLFNFSNIGNLGRAYIESLALRQGRSLGTIIAYLRAVFSPVLISFLPLGLFYWDKLKGIKKILFLIGVLGGLGIDFFRGTNKTLADYLIIFFIMFVVRSIFSARIPRPSLLNPRLRRNFSITIFMKLSKTFIIVLILFYIFFMFFSSTVPKRYGVSIYARNGEYMLDLYHPILSIFDSIDMRLAVGSLISYFTQGYYALGLSMEKPFLPTFGAGSSMVILLNITELLNTDFFFKRTYVYRNFIINNWHWHMQWSTFYVWLASDISFLGVLLVMFLVGYVVGRCWNRMINYKDYISTIVFVQMMILCFYLPANNQLFQSLEGLIGNTFWIIFWIMSITRRKRKGRVI